MAIKLQHYVPQVYLRAWKNTTGVYLFKKNDLEIGNLRNTDSILAKNHTYTIDYDHTFVFKEMPEIAKDYGNKMKEVLNKHNAIAVYEGEELKTVKRLVASDTFPFLDKWQFYKKNNRDNLARKKAILNEIKSLHSYVIENKLDSFLENDWPNTRDKFIEAVESITDYKTMTNVKIEKRVVVKLIYSMLILMCRNPAFDCFGVYPKIENAFKSIFEINKMGEEERKKSQKVVDQQIHAAWLAEIYKGLFQNEKGFCEIYAENIEEKCQIVLFRCCEENGSFITSDNPAFMFINNVMKYNRNGFYMPLTPQYLLFIGKGEDDIGSIDVKSLSNKGVKIQNSIILSKAVNSVVSNRKYLGYIL